MSYFAFEITELKVVTLAIEADSDEEAYERLLDIDSSSDVLVDAIAAAYPFDNNTNCFGEILGDVTGNVIISDGDYKRIIGEYY